MSLRSCVGSRARESLIIAAEEAVKECSSSRLEALLSSPGPGGADGLSAWELRQRHLLHQAAWLGHTACVKILLEHGATADEPHRKNGCTPLHLAHFCTIDDTDPARTILALTDAGADINNKGSTKCGRRPIDHAIQNQRLTSVKVLLSHGSQVTLQSILVAIDVASPQIIELLLRHGADCGLADGYWGQPLQRVLTGPNRCPKEPLKHMFRLLVQATVSAPRLNRVALQSSCTSVKSSSCSGIEGEVRSLSRKSPDLAQYLLVALTCNGYRPSITCIETVRRSSMGPQHRPAGAAPLTGSSLSVDWVEEYLRSGPPCLLDLVVRQIRTSLVHGRCGGNVYFGLSRLCLPTRMTELVLMSRLF